MSTAAELFEAAGNDDCRYELFRGDLRMMSPAGGRHGRIANHLAWLLSNHVMPSRLGVVLAAETGFLIETDPDTVLAPDVAFVRSERYQQIENEAGYLPLTPDLVIEVLSPSDRYSRVESKLLAWLDAGCRLVLVVDPESQTIQAMHSRQAVQIYRATETIDCSAAVPGWQLALPDVFGEA
jgi:Uma2 family endonuclease